MNTDQHLRRIRLRLTLVFAAVMGLALLVLALLAIRTDERVRESELSADLLSRAQAGANAIFFDEEGSLVLDDFEADDGLVNGYPQLYVYSSFDEEGPLIRIHRPPEPFYDDTNLNDYAGYVMFEDEVYEGSVWNEDGLDLRAWGVRLPNLEGNERQVGVVAFANADDWLEGTTEFRNQLLFIVGALVLVAGGAGYRLAGRSIRPTAAALHQQERLISDAAHELRTPVARILAAAEGGLKRDEPPEAALTRVATTATNAGEALDDLLALARMDAGRQSVQREPLRLDLLVEEVAGRHEVEVDAVKTVVNGDPGLLRRAVDNLIRNAVTHGANGDHNGVAVTVYPTRVVVSDEGDGVPIGQMETIFERFHSQAGSEGHGLGLPIVRWVARAHGGRVEVANRKDGGAEDPRHITALDRVDDENRRREEGRQKPHAVAHAVGDFLAQGLGSLLLLDASAHASLLLCGPRFHR